MHLILGIDVIPHSKAECENEMNIVYQWNLTNTPLLGQYFKIMSEKTKRQLLRVAFIVCSLTMLSPLNVGAQNWFFPFADVDGDGRVTIADVVVVADCILNGGSTGVVTNPNTGYLSAKEYGAVGDGVTDDTDALERLFEDAFQQKKAAYFDPGTYLIRRSLTLKTGMEIYGKDATITKAKAVVTSLATAATKGQTSIEVVNASRYSPGDQICIVYPDQANQCTYGIIDSIQQNVIYFTNIISDVQPGFPGCIRDYSSGVKVTTSFALLRSWSTRFDCDGVYIHDLTLDGNRITSEPKSWANSCIHIDAYYPGGYTGSTTGIEYRHPQRNFVARNLTIRNSSHDGISDQGEGGMVATGCFIENCAMHGIHMGTKYFNALISGNKLIGNGSIGAGIFFCQEVTDVVIDNNEITSFNHGCSDEEFGTCAKFVIIRNNRFNNITSYVFDFLKAIYSTHGSGLQICNNKIEGLKSQMFSADYIDNMMFTGNEVTSVTQVPSKLISITQSLNIVITGNTLPADVNITTPVVSTSTSNLINTSNSWN